MHAKARATLIVGAAVAIAASLANGASRASVANGLQGDDNATVSRIRAHLAAVESELVAADVSALTPAQRQARARHIAVLREYRAAGEFPHNHVAPTGRTPVFVDEHGTHCAVGYLLARDGRHDLVERVRASRNTATVPELAGEPELVAWLAEAGLSLDEAARIQPWYDYTPEDPQGIRSGADYTTASLIGAGLAGATIAWNLLLDDGDARTLPGVIGLGIGVAEIGLAAYGADARRSRKRDIERAPILINLGIGVVSGLLGARTFARKPPATGVGPAENASLGDNRRNGVQWSAAPWAAGSDGGIGMRLELRF